MKINLFVIYDASQSGRKFSKTEGNEIMKKSVMEKVTRIHKDSI